MVRKNFLVKEFTVDLIKDKGGLVSVFATFFVLKQSKNNEVFLDFEEVQIVLFPKFFSELVMFVLV